MEPKDNPFFLRIESCDGPDMDKPGQGLLFRLVNVENTSQSMLHGTPTTGKGIAFLYDFIVPLNLPSTEITYEEQNGKQVPVDIDYNTDETIGVVIEANVAIENYNGKDRNKLGSFRLAGEDKQNAPSF
jgi:hypothetical protein